MVESATWRRTGGWKPKRKEEGKRERKGMRTESILSYGRNGRNRNQIIMQYCIVAKEKVPEVAMEGFENED